MSVYPAIRGKFGTTDYFLPTMPVGDLVKLVKFPDEIEWNAASLEDRYQRKMQEKRIDRDLVPYFTRDDRRFSGSLVMAVKTDQVRFDPLSKMTGLDNILHSHRDPANGMGFVTLGSSEPLVALDGQHRARAFKKAIEDAPITTQPTGLAQDAISVILVKFEGEKSRYIFNKINRYAKPTSKADKLITDDDQMAVITRSLISKGVFDMRLVRTIPSNTLGREANEFTTLSVLYEANKRLITALPIRGPLKLEDMNVREREDRTKDLQKEWNRLISGIDLWNKAVADPEERGKNMRIKLRRQYVLARPVGQLALINGYARACEDDQSHIDRDGLVVRLNRLNWKLDARDWRGLLVTHNRKMISSRPASRNAGLFIAEMIGTKLTKQEKEDVRNFRRGRAS